MTLEAVLEAAVGWSRAREKFMQTSVREGRRWEVAHAEYNAAKRRLAEAVERALSEGGVTR